VAIAKLALGMIVVAAGVVYATNMGQLSALVGVVLVASLVLAIVPLRGRAPIVVAVVIGALGLAVVWGAYPMRDEHAGRILRDLGLTQAALGAWLAYATGASVSRRAARFVHGDDARKRWREGDIAFGAELARRIVVSAQPSWAALVVETAWPEPRPDAVAEMLAAATKASRVEMATLREGMTGDDPRLELARLACDVIREAQGRPGEEVGGLAAARFVLAAAQAVRDDEAATRVFAALVLPAVARAE
jgi:hypothetical protein